jgi:uncharacterized membrane protein YfcA
MNPTVLLLLKILLASLIVGFVTASIKSWVDRFFLVILLTSLVGLPIQQSITINLVVVGLAALMLALQQGNLLQSVRTEWSMLIVPAVLGGMLGRLLGLRTPEPVLLGILGIYAVLAGLRMLLVKPMPERDDKVHPAWLTPVAFLFGGFTGLISAGGKPFSVPIYNRVMGHHPQKAYALASVAVATAAWSALATQVVLGTSLTPEILEIAAFSFTLITLTALGVSRFWSPKLNKFVTWVVGLLLVLVGIRFILLGMV